MTLYLLERVQVGAVNDHVNLGDVIGYAAGTHNGIIRTYNEDRLAIVLNYKLKNEDSVVSCNFFGIYDGHGGVSVADYLKNNLHKQVLFKLLDFC